MTNQTYAQQLRNPKESSQEKEKGLQFFSRELWNAIYNATRMNKEYHVTGYWSNAGYDEDTYGIGFPKIYPKPVEQWKKVVSIPNFHEGLYNYHDITVVRSKDEIEECIELAKRMLTENGFTNYECRIEEYTKYRYYYLMEEVGFFKSLKYVLHKEVVEDGYALYFDIKW